MSQMIRPELDGAPWCYMMLNGARWCSSLGNSFHHERPGKHSTPAIQSVVKDTLTFHRPRFSSINSQHIYIPLASTCSLKQLVSKLIAYSKRTDARGEIKTSAMTTSDLSWPLLNFKLGCRGQDDYTPARVDKQERSVAGSRCVGTVRARRCSAFAALANLLNYFLTHQAQGLVFSTQIPNSDLATKSDN
ncbi:hypothetical protein ElyMa_005054800 [Elysia marginata]|uniref:Uncharacterized protein n=1 Tax=Elysia marginata TaxID=1093978 RepID=A0AAV4JDG4_9GAST|nr:hypothetical protein ElyMa_005054800 [Elysia marginata]